MERFVSRVRTTGSMLAPALLGMALLTGVLASGGSSQAVVRCNGGQPALDAQEAELFRLINEHRAQHGIAPLGASTNLNRAAAWHAHSMASGRYFAHVDSLGRSPSDRAGDCGYPERRAAENIAAGQQTAQQVFQAWKDSPGHNANMLDNDHVQVGLALHYDPSAPYRWYWVTVFSLTSDGTNALDEAGSASSASGGGGSSSGFGWSTSWGGARN